MLPSHAQKVRISKNRLYSKARERRRLSEFHIRVMGQLKIVKQKSDSVKRRKLYTASSVQLPDIKNRHFRGKLGSSYGTCLIILITV